MSFMKSYKRLDNLCKDMNDVGVTGYIQDMEQETNGKFYVAGWEDDCSRLKRYRYIRNQIAHENNADEDNMCSDEDTVWIDNFYRRIMERTDPLALYCQAVKFRSTSKPANIRTPPTSQYVPVRPKVPPTSQYAPARPKIPPTPRYDSAESESHQWSIAFAAAAAAVAIAVIIGILFFFT